MFYRAIARDFKDTARLVALCDINRMRMAYANKLLQNELQHAPVSTYNCAQFDEMIKTEKPDCVIVTTLDRLHHKYICRAMELGCDVITEKPMTVDAKKCQQILDTVKRAGKSLRVTFNYRYQPVSTQVRDLVMKGTIGEVKHVNMEWILDTTHGADYFRRWHRDKRNSGGLMVHKATHHFDLVNFWLADQPEVVYGMGDLLFYGRENAENRGETRFYYRATGSENAKDDPFALTLAGKDHLEGLYLDAEKEDGYLRDQSVFGDGISIEDVMSVIVRYKGGAMLSYSLNAFSPWEGFNVSLTGTRGRIEVKVAHSTYINAGGEVEDEGTSSFEHIMVFPMWQKPYPVEIETIKGGHGGADPVMLNDIFGTPVPDPYNRAASHTDGAMSILTGVAANECFRTHRPVLIRDLVRF